MNKEMNKAQASLEYFIIFAVIAGLTLLSVSTFLNRTRTSSQDLYSKAVARILNSQALTLTPTPTPVPTQTPPSGEFLPWGLRNYRVSASAGHKTFIIKVEPGMTYGSLVVYPLLPACDFTFKFTPVAGYQYFGKSVYTGNITYNSGPLNLEFYPIALGFKPTEQIPPGNYILEITFNDTSGYGDIIISSSIY